MAKLLPHFFMPGMFRFGLEISHGIFDLMSLSFKGGSSVSCKRGEGEYLSKVGVNCDHGSPVFFEDLWYAGESRVISYGQDRPTG